MINVFANGVIFLFPAIFNPEGAIEFCHCFQLKK